MFFLWVYWMNFVRTQKQVPMNHDKQPISVRAIEVRLYISDSEYVAENKPLFWLPDPNF